MTNYEISLIVKCIKECDKEVMVALVHKIATIIDPSTTIEQCEVHLRDIGLTK